MFCRADYVNFMCNDFLVLQSHEHVSRADCITKCCTSLAISRHAYFNKPRLVCNLRKAVTSFLGLNDRLRNYREYLRTTARNIYLFQKIDQNVIFKISLSSFLCSSIYCNLFIAWWTSQVIHL